MFSIYLSLFTTNTTETEKLTLHSPVCYGSQYQPGDIKMSSIKQEAIT